MKKTMLVVVTFFGLMVCVGQSLARTIDTASTTLAAMDQTALIAKWGIRAERMMISGAGNIVDFRYHVLDPEKAAKVVSPKIKPVLVDEKTGMMKEVPMPANIGALRNTGRNLKKDRKYFVLFNNPGRNIKKGDKVTLVMGDYKLEHIEVQ